MGESTIKHIAPIFPVNAEALKPDPKFHRRRSIIREFSLNTSTHGIPGIARSETIPNRIFWTISLLAFTGIMLFFIIASIRDYFSYPTQTSVSITIDRSQAFPAVTICNYSPVRSDTFMPAFLNYTNSRNLTIPADSTMMTPEQIGYISDFLQYLFNNNDTQGVYNTLFPLEPMLLSCIYNNQPCNASDFISFLSSMYGLCSTFNAKIKGNQNSVRLITDNGGFGRLQLQLYAHSQQYLSVIIPEALSGMVTMIHDNTELPLIDVAGIELVPGRKHKLNYKKRIHQLLASPYSECTNKIPLVMHAMFDRYHGADYAYSQVLCHTLCTQVYVYQECKCVNPNQWTIRSIVLPGSDQIIEAPLCNLTDPCYGIAAARISSTASIWNEFCSDCSEACTTVDFIVTSSSILAPSALITNMYKTVVENSGIPLSANWSTTWQTEFQQNYVAVDIINETPRIENYIDSASTSGVDLLSSVGGHTGLWIGISFLSLMELVEMLYRLLRYHYYILRRKIQHKAKERFEFF